MTKEVSLKSHEWEATFLPEEGMALASFKRAGEELIYPKSILVGPHFESRKNELIPKVPEEAFFPHISLSRAKGISDPLYNGISRYATWQFQASENKITSNLSGKDIWQGIPLSNLEGQPFKMSYEASLTEKGLEIDLSVVSDSDSLVGIQFCFAISDDATLISDVQNKFYHQGQLKPVPEEWPYNEEGKREIPLQQSLNCAFLPSTDPLKGKIDFLTKRHHFQIRYNCLCQENSWHLFKPIGKEFLCITPISSQNPWRPNLTASSLHVELSILN